MTVDLVVVVVGLLMMSDNYYLELFIIVINCFPIFYKRYKVKISETNGNQYVRTSSLFISHTP